MLLSKAATNEDLGTASGHKANKYVNKFVLDAQPIFDSAENLASHPLNADLPGEPLAGPMAQSVDNIPNNAADS